MQAAALRSPVPSRSLLRFLRCQTDVSFFSYSCAHGCPSRVTNGASGQRVARAHSAVAKPGQAIPFTELESSIFSLEPLQIGKVLRRACARTLKRKSFCTSAPAYQKAVGEEGDSSPSWQEKLWGIGARKGAKTLKPDDLPSRDDADHGSSMFNSRRILSAKAALEPRLRCTEVDENGKVILMDGEFKKTELIAKYGLLPRDLRKIDSSNLPHILVRPQAILLNLLHLRVLIKRDRVLLFDVYGSKTSYPQSAFMYDLQGKLQQKPPPGVVGLPYEFRALEAVLTSVTSELEADFESVREPVMRVLSELEDDIDRQKLRQLLILSKRVSTFEQKAKLVRDAIEELLEADDDLAAMYLTEKVHDLYRSTDDHTEVEMLLESYHKLADEIVQEASNLVSGIRNTEDLVRAILDANRNALMLLELKFSIGTLGLAMGTFIAGLYGANLENFIEETNWGFAAVTAVSTIFSLVVCWYGLARLRRIQRIKMAGDERPRLSRGQPYYEDGAALGILDSRNRELLLRAHMQRTLNNKKKWWFSR
ncbi:inner membrane magnesium transporter MRS2 precursor [Trichoderma reesei RUT C-30]|uniref:Magnesium transporter n=1 Tax=Hypocrea jecorina (strain ATCC 56765 / BCRC 32924 / NRRL 11460 / Rut C-30) TaxID=1344414 RepID=A0A024RXI2_HYPJR|nr:inner membrane magnesium transporter MRS2 precursor [Trichoderma reesei RUT C-30]